MYKTKLILLQRDIKIVNYAILYWYSHLFTYGPLDAGKSITRAIGRGALEIKTFWALSNGIKQLECHMV